MAFNKFDPYREGPKADGGEAGPAAASAAAARRAWILKYAWWITMAYTALGFGLIVYWLFR